MAYPHDQCIHQLVEAQVAQTPDAVAVVWRGRHLTYGVLNDRANALAHRLMLDGIRTGDRIGLCLERSPEMAIALLGILKAGGAFLPVDPTYPAERLTYSLRDAGVAALLTTRRLAERLDGRTDIPVLYLDGNEDIAGYPTHNPDRRAAPEALAYVIYTSGSTGRPKGAGVYHAGFVNLMSWYRTEFGLTAADRVLVCTSSAFDLTLKNIFTPLGVGAELHFPPQEVFDADAIVRTIQDEGITFVNCTPSAAYLLIDAAQRDSFRALETLRYLTLGGEPIQASRLRGWTGSADCRAQIVNTYGPSECTDVVAFHRLESTLTDGAAPVPIGRPIANTELLVLDGDLRPVPVGTVGELCISGACVGAGYINDAALTAAKFVPHPLQPASDARLYRTGDLGLCRPDGAIMFVGRADQQVKVRGFRVELGEIEAVLAHHPGVTAAAVGMQDDAAGEKSLIAHVVLALDRPATTAELRDYLKAQLPPYMVPATIVVLDRLPLTVNGKVDRHMLSSGEAIRTIEEGAFTPPATVLQGQLVALWEEILRVRPVGIDDDFFDLGGNSLLAVHLLDRIEQLCGHRLSLPELLAEPTVKHVETILLAQDNRESGLWELQAGRYGRPFFFVHGDYYLGGAYCLELVQYLDQDVPVYAFPEHGFDGRPVPASIEAMAADHVAMLRAFQPGGPYMLGGMCNGGMVAFEMAQQLRVQGQEVDLLVIIDMAPHDARLADLPIEIPQLDAIGALHARALLQYAPRPYHGPMILLWPREIPLVHSDEPTLGWSGIVPEVTVHFVAGTHDSCMAEDMQEAATCINTCLRAARAQSASA